MRGRDVLRRNGHTPIEFVAGMDGRIVWRPLDGPLADWLAGVRPKAACICRDALYTSRKCPYHGPALRALDEALEFVNEWLDEINGTSDCPTQMEMFDDFQNDSP